MTFTVYSKQGCPYCVKVIRPPQLSEQKYVELKLNRDFDKSEFIQRFGFGSTFLKLSRRINESVVVPKLSTSTREQSSLMFDPDLEINNAVEPGS